jgi:hypothetical protein
MRSYTDFLIEAQKRLSFVKMYHGTPSAEKIQKSGFNTSDVYTSTDREIAQSFGQRKGENTKVISFRVPKKDINTPGKLMKTDGQRGVDKWGREHYSTVMNPEYAKKHISKEPEGVIDAPKIPAKYRKGYFKNNPNSRFKRRTKTQLKKVQEASDMMQQNTETESPTNQSQIKREQQKQQNLTRRKIQLIQMELQNQKDPAARQVAQKELQSLRQSLANPNKPTISVSL